MEILAFPYAFGSANIFCELKNELGNMSVLRAFNYPGHGNRFGENLFNSINNIVDDAYEQIKELIYKPYCLLGYSMGGVIAYELYQKLKKEHKALPKHIFILGTREPNWKYESKNYENFKLPEVREILRKKSGTSEELLNNDEFIELVAPAVIADSIALRDYSCDENTVLPVDCGVTIIRGCKEKNIENCKDNWEKYLKEKCEYLTVDGDHFFLFNGGKKMTEKIKNIINDRVRVLL